MSVSVQVIDEHGTKCGLKINFELLPLKGLAQLERLSKGMNAPLQPTNIEATLDNFVQYLRPRLDGRFQYEHDGYVVIISSTFEVLFDWQVVSGEVRHILSNAGIQMAGGNYRGRNRADGAGLSTAARAELPLGQPMMGDPNSGGLEATADDSRWSSPRAGTAVTTVEVNPRRP